MKNFTITNPVSGVNHEISFKSSHHSPGKLVILQDGRSVGKINRNSKIVFCEKVEIISAVSKNIDAILSNN